TQQETTKAPLGAVGVGHGVALKQSKEELLCQVLRVVRRVSLASEKAVNWLPIGLAKLFERLLCPSRIPTASQDDLAPACVRKLARCFGGRAVLASVERRLHSGMIFCKRCRLLKSKPWLARENL